MSNRKTTDERVTVPGPLRLLALLCLAVMLHAINPARAEEKPANLLPSACHFYSDILPSFPSMLPRLADQQCDGMAAPNPDMVWLSLDVKTLNPKAHTAYELALFRHWTERAVIQMQYADGELVAYDVTAHNFDRYWSVGNFISFAAPARNTPVTHILVGLQNPSSIKLFRQINFVEATDWHETETDGRLIVTLIVGVLLAMLIYNIALAAALRFDFHLHYCLFVFSVVLYNVTAYGLVSHFLPGFLSVGTQMNITILALGLNGLSGLYFLCSFLEKDILGPRWNAAARGLGIAFLATSVLYVSARGWHADTIDLIFNFMSMLGILFILSTLVRALSRKSRAAVFYAVGWGLPIAGVMLRILRGFDIIPHSPLVEYGMSIGMALETVILSIGIADRISQIRRERDKVKLANEKARAASQAKSDFLARMSHEIRTPLNAVIGLSDLMTTTPLDTKQQGYIKNIRLSGDILLNLLNDILDFSKIEADKVTIEKLPFSVQGLIDKVHAVIGPKAEEKSLVLRFEGHKNLPEQVIGDPTRLAQILINLANNAVKFTDAGSIIITFEADRNKDGQLMLTCRVTDTGVGMSADQVGRLFQSFTQADETITRRYGGTGLGLAISKQLVELMGGTIGVESAPGEGSCFHFRLPLTLVTQTISAPDEMPEQAAKENVLDYPLLKGKHVLVAEDNEINQLLACRILEHAGATVEIVYDGQQAVERAKSGGHDLILMDIQMPIMNGLEATRAIRTHGVTIPIIAMTANAAMEDRATCLAAGMNDHVSKPFQPDDLYKALNRCLDTVANQTPENEATSQQA